MIILFEKFNNKPNVNSLSPEFWKMVRLVNWKGAIKFYNINSIPVKYTQEKRDEYLLKMQGRLYLKYEYDEIENFNNEYYRFYMELYDYFFTIWTDDNYNNIMPSDDGYSDLISSIIGKGKNFTKKCIYDPIYYFVKMVKENDYIENFGYLLNINFNEYIDIKSKFDPFYGDVKKYNI